MMIRVDIVASLLLALLVQGSGAFAPSSTGTGAAAVRGSRSTASSVPKSKSVALAATSKQSDVCTIQILMSDTGGGHRASANALRDALNVLHPGRIECDIVDLYTDYGPFFPYNSYVPLYKIMAEYDFLWKAFYEFGTTPLGLFLNEFLQELFCFEPFKECLERPSGSTSKRADMVVSVHPLCQDIPLKILSSIDSNGKTRAPQGRVTPFVTVVTDLGGAHPTWFNPSVDKCFVPSDALHKCARDRKLEESQITQYGLPIREGFWATSDEKAASAFGKSGGGGLEDKLAEWFKFGGNKKENSGSGKKNSEKSALQSKLGIIQNVPTVLVVGGGDGMGGIIKTAQSLGNQLDADSDADSDKPSYQMVVVCGSNQKAKADLEAYPWGPGVNVCVNGFVNNMDEWMRASDAIVTKAGPGTIAEASICGLPCLLSAYLPGQEEGNLDFVKDSGFGTYSGNPKVIAETISSWLASPDMLEDMRNNALKAARPSATLDIAKDLADILFEYKGQQKMSSSRTENTPSQQTASSKTLA